MSTAQEPRRRRRRGGGDGGREMPMVPDVQFTSYYGRPVVKPAPWSHEIAAYLFLGGLAGGSGLLAAGAQLTGRPVLRRNSRLAALGAVMLSAAALISDLGRPERFFNMLRTIKLTSPMSLGSWILSAFSTGAGVAAAAEVDRLTGERLPLGPLRGVLRAVEGPAGLEAAVFAAPLAVYTAVLLGDTATPTWHGAHRDLPFVFVSSASLASGGLAMLTTPVAQAGPARRLAVLGVIGDLLATRLMEQRMDPIAAEPLHDGRAGAMLRASERLAVAGGIGALLGGRNRVVAALSGVALLAASALTRFGVFEAGIASAKDPRYTIEPQKRRLAARRAAGITWDSITTAG
ncbi:NrfD/PsrC family molybdoenzyme membrane anchor subunit [[Mycobacterium] nativiensis]|uniref:NrfD/PsrC family molybdoenzyme membrane anchor subunit n=1 Tax=[Mycobacterium] nativiensis TaxID=2855503 RepID=A0ABU5XWN3_9MYCO|nr:NrfD/PsrC family molybdoenzyme membrane anchor subunit [Mycolicibacter sp. MYC340]MEB3032343.1 NrfD/PsrC family molybdoenzyme membrane anchor subunit [Mycolicibacter sp. MYC340]